ncbi:MAG TPA: NACHT domain-containing protein [Gemmatimonadaceae bacterium]|jgi:hypothetical protein
MDRSVPIRILEPDKNRRGDLFGRLMGELFVALGYEQPRMNVHKSGRELDLVAKHRLESRKAIAECKATAAPIGGDDLNKFVGALDAEHDDDLPVTGYFISLAGFTETALLQEVQRRRTKIITLDGENVLEELIKGRQLIPTERATEVAGRLVADRSHLALDPDFELLAHERGWSWAVYFGQGGVRTHLVLVHSDGTPLGRPVADELIAADQSLGGTLHTLGCLNPNPISSDDGGEEVKKAIAAYRTYLEAECGFIQLDGLPADGDLGSRRLRLENLFVPTHIIEDDDSGLDSVWAHDSVRLPIGAALSRGWRRALLSPPGGGKSTLLKRLAIAYIDPARRTQIDDGLSGRDLFPIFLRCRELRELARASFGELLDALSQRDPIRQHARAFRAHVDRLLLDGDVLLLIDGLDEIANEGDRAAFVSMLRATLQVYPQTAIVVTSRPAGFRHVAGQLADVCRVTELAPFDPEDIERLCTAWHREVFGDVAKVRSDATDLAKSIVENDRILRLAMNPLLLTTLLLVKRWVGSLPRRRTILYGKAVEALLATWNTEGHEPIPEDEAIPQLCFVASAMMANGVQRISRPRLAELLRQARQALPTELGYVKGSVGSFIERIEERSSLLMMTGYDAEDGQLAEFFEFRHLTFQEFLTARALVEGWYPERDASETLADVLMYQIDNQRWREVIPLAAVLGGRATDSLIARLTEVAARISPYVGLNELERAMRVELLFDCLGDDASARPDVVGRALREVVRHGRSLLTAASAPALFDSKYGAELRAEISSALDSKEWHPGPTNALFALKWKALKDARRAGDLTTFVTRAEEQIQSTELASRREGLVAVAVLCRLLDRWRTDNAHPYSVESLSPGEATMVSAMCEQLGDSVFEHAFDGHDVDRYLGLCAVMELLSQRAWTPSALSEVITRLHYTWQGEGNSHVRWVAARAIASSPIGKRGAGLGGALRLSEAMRLWRDTDDSTRPEWLTPSSSLEALAACVVAWHFTSIPDQALQRRLKALQAFADAEFSGTLRDMMRSLRSGPNDDGRVPAPTQRGLSLWPEPRPPIDSGLSTDG